MNLVIGINDRYHLMILFELSQEKLFHAIPLRIVQW